METKRGKYDTNPLDPDVVKHTEEVWGEGGGSAPTQQVNRGATGAVGNTSGETSRSNVYSEAPTRRYDQATLESSYPSVFVPPPHAPPTQYQQAANPYAPATQRPTERPVAGIGWQEKWVLILPYAPMYLGLIMSLIELFIVPRKEVKVRFHASQALALHVGILLVDTVFRVISGVTGSSFGGVMFRLAAFVFLIVSMMRVWRGEPHVIAPLNEPAQWFNEHIEPRNQG